MSAVKDPLQSISHPQVWRMWLVETSHPPVRQ